MLAQHHAVVPPGECSLLTEIIANVSVSKLSAQVIATNGFRWRMNNCFGNIHFMYFQLPVETRTIKNTVNDFQDVSLIHSFALIPREMVFYTSDISSNITTGCDHVILR